MLQSTMLNDNQTRIIKKKKGVSRNYYPANHNFFPFTLSYIRCLIKKKIHIKHDLRYT